MFDPSKYVLVSGDYIKNVDQVFNNSIQIILSPTIIEIERRKGFDIKDLALTLGAIVHSSLKSASPSIPAFVVTTPRRSTNSTLLSKNRFIPAY